LGHLKVILHQIARGVESKNKVVLANVSKKRNSGESTASLGDGGERFGSLARAEARLVG